MPVPPSFASDAQRQLFAQWLEAQRVERRVSKGRLAAKLGHSSVQQVNKFLRGQMLPMPETLRSLCDEMGVQWLTACAQAGYYSEVLWALADMEALGFRWCRQDGVFPEGAQYRALGVLRIGDAMVTAAIEDQKFAGRYHLGSWTDVELPVHYDVEGVPAEEAARIKRSWEARSRGGAVIVPKPHAAAILIATAGFPRRGDIYKDGAAPYVVDVLENCSILADAARGLRPRKLPALLQLAEDVLRDKTVPLESRRPVAAEYMVAWADMICSRYTFYARLAVFEFWGEAGSSVSTLTPYIEMPRLKVAARPEPTIFAMQL